MPAFLAQGGAGSAGYGAQQMGQTLRMLPCGLCVSTFSSRHIGALKSVHLRHDCPRLFPGWEVEGLEVFMCEQGESRCRGIQVNKQGATFGKCATCLS